MHAIFERKEKNKYNWDKLTSAFLKLYKANEAN